MHICYKMRRDTTVVLHGAYTQYARVLSRVCKQLCRPITRGGVDSNKCAERGRGTLRAVRPTTKLRARPDQAQGATRGTSYRFLFRIIWL